MMRLNVREHLTFKNISVWTIYTHRTIEQNKEKMKIIDKGKFAFFFFFFVFYIQKI
jgi:hypothetical protein